MSLKVIGWSASNTRTNAAATGHIEPSASPGQFNANYLQPSPAAISNITEPLEQVGNYSLSCLGVSGFPTNQSAKVKNGNFNKHPEFNSTYLTGDPVYNTIDPLITPSSREYSIEVLQGQSGANDTPAETLKNILKSVKGLPISQAEYLAKSEKVASKKKKWADIVAELQRLEKVRQNQNGKMNEQQIRILQDITDNINKGMGDIDPDRPPVRLDFDSRETEQKLEPDPTELTYIEPDPEASLSPEEEAANREIEEKNAQGVARIRLEQKLDKIEELYRNKLQSMRSRHDGKREKSLLEIEANDLSARRKRRQLTKTKLKFAKAWEEKNNNLKAKRYRQEEKARKEFMFLNPDRYRAGDEEWNRRELERGGDTQVTDDPGAQMIAELDEMKRTRQTLERKQQPSVALDAVEYDSPDARRLEQGASALPDADKIAGDPGYDPKNLDWESELKRPDKRVDDSYREFFKRSPDKKKGEYLDKPKVDVLLNHYNLRKLPEYDDVGQTRKQQAEWVLKILRHNPDFTTRVHTDLLSDINGMSTRDFKTRIRQDLSSSSSSSRTGRGLGTVTRNTLNAYDRKKQKRQGKSRRSWASKYV